MPRKNNYIIALTSALTLVATTACVTSALASLCLFPKFVDGPVPESYLWTCTDDPDVYPDGTLVYTKYSPSAPALVGRARNDSLYYLDANGDTLATRRLRSPEWTCLDGTSADTPNACSGGIE